ncbi:MAG: tRNA epoxyqueuosine(34) reductase QueG [Elusimicrobia bacterium]|nr:tRNA epoxyqueuosine(34) reductase QueG [Elusimicrobiota bacterium]
MLENLIKQKAQALGASLCGIAPARLPQEDLDIQAYQDWLAQNMHGSMGYMKTQSQIRQDITYWYPQAQSVILCGFNYPSHSFGATPQDCNTGKFARYALGLDYHKVLRKKLKQLLVSIQAERPEIHGKIFLDTSPILERRYARYAGIGWSGKNTMMISSKIGSYFFLGGLALDISLSYDEPVPDHCGTCRRCLTACPTKAFPEPYVLNASRCIAYLTIEHRGPIPEPLRDKIGSWVFGCDVCQEVCPWNRFSFSSALPEMAPQIQPEIPLQELAEVNEEAFQETFKKTPVERTGSTGLLRNSLLAMGNSGNPEHIPTLETYCQNPDPMLREQAEWSLKKIEARKSKIKA